LIKAVFFDFWDTLIYEDQAEDQKLKHIRVKGLTQVLADAGFSISPKDVAQAVEAVDVESDRVREKTGREFDTKSQVQMMMEKLGIPKSNERLSQNLWRVYTHSILSIKLKARDDAEPILRSLKERGYKIGLICNIGRTPGVVIREILQKFGFLRYFDVLMFSDECGFRKPRPEIFLEAISRMDAEPSETVHIGDRPDLDVLGAKGAGLKAIHLQLTDQPYSTDLPKPDATIKTLLQVPATIKRLAFSEST